MSGRLPWALGSVAATVTSSAIAKWFLSGCFQSTSQTSLVLSPGPSFTFTAYRSSS